LTSVLTSLVKTRVAWALPSARNFGRCVLLTGYVVAQQNLDSIHKEEKENESWMGNLEYVSWIWNVHLKLLGSTRG